MPWRFLKDGWGGDGQMIALDGGDGSYLDIDNKKRTGWEPSKCNEMGMEEPVFSPCSRRYLLDVLERGNSNTAEGLSQLKEAFMILRNDFFPQTSWMKSSKSVWIG